MKKLGLSLVYFSFLIGSMQGLGAAVYSTVRDRGITEKTCYDNCLHIKKGWQLFGLSGGIANVNEMFKDKGSAVNALWAYDGEKQKWKFYSPDSSLMSIANSLSYETLNTLDATEGFWLQGKGDSTICTPTPDTNQTTLPTSVTFSEGPDMKVARMGHWIIPLPDNNIEVIGGRGNGFTSLASAEKWDATTNSFTSTGTNATHDMAAMAKLSDGTYFISGGAADLGGAPGNNAIELFNPLDGTFTSAGTMSKGRMNHSAVEIGDGKVLIVGGWYDPASALTPEIYDLATHTSSLTGPLNTPRSLPWVLPTNDGKAVVFWGLSTRGDTPVNSVELYNPADNNFTVLASNMLGEAGWRPLIFNLPYRPLSSQKMSNGKYLFWGHKDSETSLITFDPETKSFAKLNTTPALPAYTDEAIYDVLVDNKHNVAIALAVKYGADPQILTVYLVNLSNNIVTKMNNGYTLPSDFHINVGSDIILNDNRIMITGGYSQTGYNTNFSPVTKTLFIEFK